MKSWVIFLALFVFILLGFSLFFGLYEVKFFSSKASVKTVSFSVDNSYVFITPLQARANGQEKIRVTVFVLDDQGLGVLGKNVILAPNEALNIENIQALTDNFGKAYFDVSSTKAGDYFLDVKVDGQSLKQSAHLTFN
ncbi:Ig-like domain-containing protein [Patescibacteria group bacterium]|nr:Ig-like domain-containing protein [Patescibacteria group bacterium]